MCNIGRGFVVYGRERDRAIFSEKQLLFGVIHNIYVTCLWYYDYIMQHCVFYYMMYKEAEGNIADTKYHLLFVLFERNIFCVCILLKK